MVDHSIHKPKIEGYMIYNPKKGLYSAGGTTPKWKKKPKIWSGMGPLKNHINMVAIGSHYINMYTNRTTKDYYKRLYPDFDETKHTQIFGYQNLYDDCVVIDLATMQEDPDFIKNYCADFIKRTIAERRYYHRPEILVIMP